ncbi:MAG: methyltransferase domain-containing protein [Acetobacteraceae bacterium]|nr:methyltransferase domain-containing protein [Acetobacteraceae bacterium]
MSDTLEEPAVDTGNAIRTCPACGQGRMTVFHQVARTPTNSCILWDAPEEAKAASTGEVKLGFCGSCGFICNTAFRPEIVEYSARYEETQGFSGTFNAFHHALAMRLIEKHDLHGKTVLEIGCGKGEFLMLLSELGGNRCIGIDPGVRPERLTGNAAERITLIPDFYSEKYSDYDVDFVACKMTLEHIIEPFDFVAKVRKGLGHRTETLVFFQVPEMLRILRDCAFEDIYYEHCSYFTAGSLSRLFAAAGFRALDLRSEYGEQYLTIEAYPNPAGAAPVEPSTADMDELRELVGSFPARMAVKMQTWRERLEGWRREGKRVVIWGSGSKAVSFLTSFGSYGDVSHAVDINPYRQGAFVPVTAQPIVAPRNLQAINPDVIIVMNAIYEPEIRKSLADMGLAPEVFSL